MVLRLRTWREWKGVGDYGCHQGEVQAFSHIWVNADADTIGPPRLPARNLTENAYQSRSIIGWPRRPNNLPKGNRTTKGNPHKALKLHYLGTGNITTEVGASAPVQHLQNAQPSRTFES